MERIDSMEQNPGNNLGTPAEPNVYNKAEPTAPDLAEWIAEQDDRLATAFNSLHENPPTIFNSSVEILEAIREAARLSGRREVLEDLKFTYTKMEQDPNYPANDYSDYLKSLQKSDQQDQDND